MKAVLAFLMVGLLSGSAFGQMFPTYSDRLPPRALIEKFDLALGAGPAGMSPRPLVKLALGLLKDFEGWSAKPYNDAVSLCTIGYGHLIAKAPCSVELVNRFASDHNVKVPLSSEHGEALLEDDTKIARLAVQEMVSVNLTNEQFGALSTFVFNVGTRAFARSTMLRLLNRGEYDLAAKEFGRWVMAGDKILPGLVARRACEESLSRGQLKPRPDGSFTRQACAALGAAPDVGPLIDILKGE